MTNSPKQGMPVEGQTLTVCLPLELTRAQVIEVVDQDHIRAKLVQTPMAKTHSFQFGQTVDFVRMAGALGERWESV